MSKKDDKIKALQAQVESMWTPYDLTKEQGWAQDGPRVAWEGTGWQIIVQNGTVMLIDRRPIATTSAVGGTGPKSLSFYCPHPALAVGVAKQLREILYSIHEARP